MWKTNLILIWIFIIFYYVNLSRYIPIYILKNSCWIIELTKIIRDQVLETEELLNLLLCKFGQIYYYLYPQNFMLNYWNYQDHKKSSYGKRKIRKGKGLHMLFARDHFEHRPVCWWEISPLAREEMKPSWWFVFSY